MRPNSPRLGVEHLEHRDVPSAAPADGPPADPCAVHTANQVEAFVRLAAATADNGRLVPAIGNLRDAIGRSADCGPQ